MGYSAVRLCRAVAIAGCCGLMLAACGKKDGDGAAASGRQIVAHVGDEVVTIQELDNEFRKTNTAPDKQKDPESIRRVLNDLVVRKFLLQQALTQKLDREPGVLLDLIRLREQALQNAFLMRAVASKAPGKADIDKYIAENPSRFAGRKLLSVEEIGFPLEAAGQSVVESNRDAKSLDEIDQKLTSAGIAHSRQTGTMSSGDIPQDFFNSVEARKMEDVFFLRSGVNGVFFKVKGEEARPLEGEAAAALARQLLNADALKAETSLASYSASLEAKYEGEYAKIMQRADGTTGKNN